MRATKKAQYALRAVIFLAKKKEVSSLRSIAEAEGISFDYLEKILSKLEKSNLVESKKGVTGGYLLAKNPKSINLKDVFDAVGEPISLVDCLKKRCPLDSKCRAIKAWKKVNTKIEEALLSVKLSDLL